jgi:plastocyanin
MRRYAPLLSACALLFFLVGCGGGDTSDTENGGQEATQQEETEPAGSAMISGAVQFEGEAPEREELETNRECAEIRGNPPLSQNAVVNDNGTLKWVFVYVKEGLGDQSFSTPNASATLDQEGCMYRPHVLGVQAGQAITIRNSDPFQHNIHALPETNRPFNFSQPVEGMENERTFPQEEVMVRVKCDVHGWMESWIGVVGHPYHSTTGGEGTYGLDNLPAGDYVIEAWHEEYGAKTQEVTVAEEDTTSVDFTFSGGETADATNQSDMRVVTWTVDH